MKGPNANTQREKGSEKTEIVDKSKHLLLTKEIFKRR